MEYEIAYSELSEQAREAWQTISGLPLTTPEQHEHAWQVLCSEWACLADEPRPGLHVVGSELATPVGELYLSGPELAALRVMITWLKGSDRAGRLPDLPIYPELAEAIVAQCGDAPWPGVWSPGYLDALANGTTLVLHLQTSAQALMQLLEAALQPSTHICPGWPPAARQRLHMLLCDIWYWLHSMVVAHEHQPVA